MDILDPLGAALVGQYDTKPGRIDSSSSHEFRDMPHAICEKLTPKWTFLTPWGDPVGHIQKLMNDGSSSVTEQSNSENPKSLDLLGEPL